MNLYKLFAPAIVLSLALTSCGQKNYNCVCAGDKICGTPYIVEEINGKTKQQAKAKCDTYDAYHPELDMTTSCEVEAAD
ncbi:MAG: hypothetical protein JNL72_07100 [Flavipsychrobacter sp.]|nr:hypothetical protein [Flavipsychrobacter sp.]